MLRYLNSPRRGDTPPSLPPFQARRVGDAELCSDLINGFPGEGWHVELMGQVVPYVKADMSRDIPTLVCENQRMSEWLSEKEFKEIFCKRIARLRDGRGWTQQDMAKALDIPHERYKKYETRSPMPVYLLPRFAMLVDRDIEFLVTGRLAPQARRGPRSIATGTDG